MRALFLNIIFLKIILISLIFANDKFTPDNEEEIVKDNYTGLIWTQCPIHYDRNPGDCSNEQHGQFNWDEAFDVCRNLTHNGKDDWRLPSLRELQSIIYYKERVGAQDENVEDSPPIGQIDEDSFKRIKYNVFWGLFYSHFWTSSICKNNNDEAWFVDFHFGSANRNPKASNDKFVRCVRGPDPD